MDAATAAPRSIATLRAEFSRMARRSHAENPQEFTRAVRAALGAQAVSATPEQWIAAARALRVPCRRCAGTGDFITMIENGVPKGPGGVCYRCAGKGYQTDTDAARNATADRFYSPRDA